MTTYTPATLADLLARMRARDESLGDWTSLPTYGGDEPPTGTASVWSWDDTHLIVGTCADDVAIVARAEYAEGEPVTDDRIASFMSEAGAQGDREAYDTAERALRGDAGARASCVEWIRDAEAMRDRTDYGRLCDYRTGEPLRRATEGERDASLDAAERDGGRGVIEVDGRDVYVEG